MLTLKEFKEARVVLSGVIRNTSLVYSPAFSKATGNQIYIKPENMQVTGAYKIRGAYYKISTLTPDLVGAGHLHVFRFDIDMVPRGFGKSHGVDQMGVRDHARKHTAGGLEILQRHH